MSAGEFSPQRHHGTKDFNSFFASLCLEGESVFLQPIGYETPGQAFRAVRPNKQKLGHWRVMDVRFRPDTGRNAEAAVT